MGDEYRVPLDTRYGPQITALRAEVESLQAQLASERHETTLAVEAAEQVIEGLSDLLAAVRTDLSVARGVVSELLQWIIDVSDKPWRLHDRDQRVAEAHAWLRATPPVTQLPPTDA